MSSSVIETDYTVFCATFNVLILCTQCTMREVCSISATMSLCHIDVNYVFTVDCRHCLCWSPICLFATITLHETLLREDRLIWEKPLNSNPFYFPGATVAIVNFWDIVVFSCFLLSLKWASVLTTVGASMF